MTASLSALPTVSPEAFFAVEMRVGVVLEAKPFPEARKPAYQVWVDFGEGYGVRKTSAQITQHYTPESLLGRKVVGWVNAPEKQIGPFLSQFLILGAHDTEGQVVLLAVGSAVPVGTRIS
jgi:tRNA-binding protein